MVDVDTHLLAHGVTNDKKILSVLDNRDSALLTKDKNDVFLRKGKSFGFLCEGLLVPNYFKIISLEFTY